VKFLCPVCGKLFRRDLMLIIRHTEKHIIDAIKKSHPEWKDTEELDRKCYEYYRSQLHF